MEFVNFKTRRRKIGERNYWLGEIARLVNRRIPHLAKLVEGWPVEILKQSYLESKGERNPAMAWWTWRKKFLEKPLGQKKLIVDN